jgi:hypothetical protein
MTQPAACARCQLTKRAELPVPAWTTDGECILFSNLGGPEPR